MTVVLGEDASGFTLEGVGLEIGGRAIVRPLDLRIVGNRIHGLIGPNGSGKTSLLRMLARHQEPSRGAIRYGGDTLAAWNARAFAREVAYVPQQLPPAQNLSVRELVALGRYPWHGPFRRMDETDRAAVADALRIAGLDDLAGRQVDTLSGGERQRAWVAMMIAQAGRFLILDEPTSALDIAHQAQLLDVLHAVARERGLGVIMSFHDINIASRFCDQVLAMKEGVLVASGSPNDIVRTDILSDIYGIAMETMPHPLSSRPIGFIR